jgi:hypothetical protein
MGAILANRTWKTKVIEAPKIKIQQTKEQN